jgi:hypothetical protein
MGPYHKKIWTYALIIIFILFFYTFSFAQTENITGVKFKDGSIIYGRVIEMNANDIRIETDDGKTISRNFDDVVKLLIGSDVDIEKEVKKAPEAEKILQTEAQIIQLTHESPKITRKVVIPDGTELCVVTINTISSGKVVTGSYLKFEVCKDVIVDGVIVIQKGAVVVGYVSDAKRAGRIGKKGSLSISVESTLTIDNQPIKLRSSGNKQEGYDRAGAVIATSIIFGPIGLFKRGTNAEILKGTTIQAYTDESKIVNISDKASAVKQDITIKAVDKHDLYNELLKLKDLKDKGILTEEEFEVQKKKTLERY